MKIAINTKDDITILSLNGKLIEKHAENFKKEVLHLVNKGINKILVMMSNISHIDNSGILACDAMSRLVKDSNGKLIFSDVSWDVWQLIREDSNRDIFIVPKNQTWPFFEMMES